MPFQSAWHEQGLDRKGENCVLEVTPQVKMETCILERSELEDFVWESIASRTLKGDYPSRELHS